MLFGAVLVNGQSDLGSSWTVSLRYGNMWTRFKIIFYSMFLIRTLRLTLPGCPLTFTEIRIRTWCLCFAPLYVTTRVTLILFDGFHGQLCLNVNFYYRRGFLWSLNVHAHTLRSTLMHAFMLRYVNVLMAYLELIYYFGSM